MYLLAANVTHSMIITELYLQTNNLFTLIISKFGVAPWKKSLLLKEDKNLGSLILNEFVGLRIQFESSLELYTLHAAHWVAFG